MLKKLNINKDRAKKVLQQALSPAFLIILMGSFLLWYMTKLSYEYNNVEMPLNVRIDGQRYRVTAVVNARGSVLMAQKLSLKGKINLKMDELTVRKSKDDPGALTITPASLQRAIDAKTSDIKVTQIIDAPDFKPAPAKDKESRKERREKRRQEVESMIEEAPALTE